MPDMTDRFTTHGIDSDALAQHAIERMTHALNQHEDRVSNVVLSLRDVNGPKGGDDQEVKVIVHLKGGSDVIVEEKGADAYAVFSVVADRVKQVVGRKLDKQQTRH